MGKIIHETHRRSLAKVACFRVVSTITSFLITYAIFGSVTGAIVQGIAANIAMTILHYINERIWNRIEWGIVKNDKITRIS